MGKNEKGPIIRVLLAITFALVLALPIGATVHIEKNLTQAYKKLQVGDFCTAIIIAPFITIPQKLKHALDAMPSSGKTRLVIITLEHNANRLLAQLPRRAIEDQEVIIRTTNRPVHEKVMLFIDNKLQNVHAYFGSANPTYNQFRNVELVLSSTNMPEILQSKSYIFQVLSQTRTPSKDVKASKQTTPNRTRVARLARSFASPHRSKRKRPLTDLVTPPTKSRKQHLKATPEHTELLSSFAQPLIPFMLDRIRPDQRCNYKLATMTLNHPALVSTLGRSIRISDSTFKIIIDEKTAWHAKNSESTLYKLMQLWKKYPRNLQIRKHTGTGHTGAFHAKLFLRQPVASNKACRALAIPGSINLTTQSEKDSNLILLFPSSATNEKTIVELSQEFDNWWISAQSVLV